MKRLLIILLSIIAIVSCELAEQPLIEEIEENAPAWDSGMSGTGSEKNPYVIASEEEFLLFKENIENGTLETEGKVFSLESDLDFSDMESWDPVGNAERASEEAVGTVFKGMFDGNGHTIALPDMTDYTPTDTDDSAFGLFSAVVGEGSGVRNLTVSGKLVTNSENAGMIAGLATNGAVIENCTTAVGSSITGAQAGGLVGRMMGSGKITGSTNNASVTGTVEKAGGLAHVIYYPSGSFVVSNSYNHGTIKGQNHVGGLVGLATSVAFSDSSNDGDVYGNYSTGGAIGCLNPDSSLSNVDNSGDIYAIGETSNNGFGGIVGRTGDWEEAVTRKSTIDGSENTGNFIFGETVITSSGGIVGSIGGANNLTVSITNSSNASDINSNGGSSIGGIVGAATAHFVVDTVSNTGKISGQSTIGGILGSDSADLDMTGAENTGIISGGRLVGGIIGSKSSGKIELRSSVNEGDININDTPNSSIGGIIGYLASVDSATIEKVINRGAITSNERCDYVGGIVGSITQSSNVVLSGDNGGDIASEGAVGIGGILGRVSSTDEITVKSSNNSGSVKAGNSVGGIIGSIANPMLIDGCHNTADIVAAGYYYTDPEGKTTFLTGNAGGIVGNASTGSDEGIKVSNCTNSGSITSMQRTGGIVGSILPNNSTIENCTNSGTINGYWRSGGIVGQTNNNATITDCTNSGNMNNKHGDYVLGDSMTASIYGGIVGYAYADTSSKINVSGCTVSGMVDYEKTEYISRVGGIFGIIGTKEGFIGNFIADASDCGISDFSFTKPDDMGTVFIGGTAGQITRNITATFSGCTAEADWIDKMVYTADQSSTTSFDNCTLNGSPYSGS